MYVQVYATYVSLCLYRIIGMSLCFFTLACDNITINCPRGSQCKVDETVHQAYCEASCDLDNGGCADDEVCSVLEPVTCINPPCPSRILCTGIDMHYSSIIL